MVMVKFDGLTDAQRAWLIEDERLWCKAYEIVSKYPHLDVGGVHHTLRNMRRSPEERLKRGLRRIVPSTHAN